MGRLAGQRVAERGGERAGSGFGRQCVGRGGARQGSAGRAGRQGFAAQTRACPDRDRRDLGKVRELSAFGKLSP